MEAPTTGTDQRTAGAARPSFGEALRVWLKIGCLGFGGPAGQIALMHRILVDEKRWIDEPRFLHALNFCMLLPGPEATQLAAYVGWLLHGTRGGVAAGLLFVLPGFLVILALSILYVVGGDVPLVAGILFGLKAAVLAVVAEALLRVGRRALKGPGSGPIAAAAFVAIAFLAVPFPLIVAAAAIIGLVIGRTAPHLLRLQAAPAEPLVPPNGAGASAAGFLRNVLVWGAIWLVPVALLTAIFGTRHVFTQEALFFSKAAIVTFGGAYAVLAYVAQQAVETYQWLRPDEMLTGLGLAETTPGPLILVLVFVGFLGGYRGASGFDPLTGGIIGAVVTAWVTFVPSLLFIFAGAPFIERLIGNRLLTGALAAVTAAVVGVIANLALWFTLHLLFRAVGEAAFGPLRLPVPVIESFDWRAALIAALALLLLFPLRFGMLKTLAAAAAAGALLGSAASG
jgi:chromate transporter